MAVSASFLVAELDAPPGTEQPVTKRKVSANNAAKQKNKYFLLRKMLVFVMELAPPKVLILLSFGVAAPNGMTEVSNPHILLL